MQSLEHRRKEPSMLNEAVTNPVLPSPPQRIGASPSAIRAHNDVSNEFFRAWLDPTMTYSCAMWRADREDLQSAQERKLDHHIMSARAHHAARVLDIGCGWGSALFRMVGTHGVDRAVGLTLSAAQAEQVRSAGEPRIDVRLESWANHQPTAPYDAILSIGAFEHFARPEHSRYERVASYRHFFERCRGLLRPDGSMSLQTMAFGNGKFVPDTPLADIFPESHLPRLSEIAEAFDGVFEVEVVRNDRIDYERTLASWIARLEKNWDSAARATTLETAVRYRRYLEFTRVGFAVGLFDLLRLTLRARPSLRRASNH
jgi:cyclopropane-fatty-acyl-phospholipid synthase